MPDPSELRIAAIIREAREAKNMTQDELAGAASLGIATVKRAEGGAAVSAQTLKSLCSALELQADQVRDAASMPPMPRSGDNAGPRFLPWPKPGRGELLATWMAIALPTLWAIASAVGSSGIGWQEFQENGMMMATTFSGMASVAGFAVGGVMLSELYDRRPGQNPVPTALKMVTLEALVMGAALVALSAWVILSLNLTVATIVGPGISMGLVVTIFFRIHFLGMGRKKGRDDFEAGMPGILVRLDSIMAAQITAESRVAAMEAIQEAFDLASSAARENDVRPLGLLARDIGDQVSSRRALADYLRVARVTTASHPEGSQIRAEADIATDSLALRVSGLT